MFNNSRLLRRQRAYIPNALALPFDEARNSGIGLNIENSPDLEPEAVFREERDIVVEIEVVVDLAFVIRNPSIMKQVEV